MEALSLSALQALSALLWAKVWDMSLAERSFDLIITLTLDKYVRMFSSRCGKPLEMLQMPAKLQCVWLACLSQRILISLMASYHTQVANPVSGANFPPPETPQSEQFQGVSNLTISSQLWVEHIYVNEGNHSFEARYWWAMNYEDARTADQISETNSSDDCSQ